MKIHSNNNFPRFFDWLVKTKGLHEARYLLAPNLSSTRLTMQQYIEARDVLNSSGELYFAGTAGTNEVIGYRFDKDGLRYVYLEQDLNAMSFRLKLSTIPIQYQEQIDAIDKEHLALLAAKQAQTETA